MVLIFRGSNSGSPTSFLSMIALRIRKVISSQKLLNMSPVHQLSVSVIEALMNSVGRKCKSVNLKVLFNYSDTKLPITNGI